MAVLDTHLAMLVRNCIAYIDIRNEQAETGTDTVIQPHQ